MNEEKALRLFGQCYNSGDFAPLIRKLGRKAFYEAHNRLYLCSGRERVAALLNEKAAELKALPEPNRAYKGFLIVKRELIGSKPDHCVVLTGADTRNVLGVVRIKCGWLSVKSIKVLDPAACEYTRADYLGKG